MMSGIEPDMNDNDVLKSDVVVVGGGLAGLSLTAALGTAGVSVVCIDRDEPQVQVGDDYDIRTTAIAYGSKQILSSAGVWSFLENEAGPILEIRVADQRSANFVHYDHGDVGDQPLGWIIDNVVIRRALFQRITELGAVTHLAPATVTRIERTAAGVTANLADGRRVQARLVVGADGRQSMVRRAAGIGTIFRPYGQSAIVCTIGHERPHRGVAIEHFFAGGPFAVLPMTDNRASIVWSEQSGLVDRYLGLPDAAFREELRRRLGDHLGDFKVIGGRAAYPLSVLLAHRQTDDRLALVGEAAHAIHPVAGQGLNMGLRDVAALAEVVTDQFRLGLDVGSADTLARYERWRRFDNLLLTVVCDGLVNLFSTDLIPLKAARQAGLGIVDQIPPLKQFFMRHAMGVVGHLPRMVRGETL